MQLTTERLILREFQVEDWTATYAYESDPTVVRYQSNGLYTPEESRAYIVRSMATAVAAPRRVFDLAVTLKSDGRLIGRCGLNIKNPEMNEAALWYVLHRSFWGRGLIPEAARALVDFGFQDLSVHRLWAECDPRNVGSERVMQKLGMRKEAQFKESCFIKNEWCDSVVYGLLEREWHAARRASPA